jgi:hypothetical protein
MSGELSMISSHLPVVLHNDLITDIELEDNHRSRGSGWTPGGRGLLFDTCPVAEHGKEQLTETHAPHFFNCSRNRAVRPQASSSLAEEKAPPLAPPPSCGARFPDARSWFFNCSRNRAVCPQARDFRRSQLVFQVLAQSRGVSAGARFPDARSWLSTARAIALCIPAASAIATALESG